MKRIEIKLRENDSFFEAFDEKHCVLKPEEYHNIYIEHEIYDSELDYALNVLITYMMQKKLNNILIDLKARDFQLSPIKDMTIKDIEEKLGYKINIIEEDK